MEHCPDPDGFGTGRSTHSKPPLAPEGVFLAGSQSP